MVRYPLHSASALDGHSIGKVAPVSIRSHGFNDLTF